MFPAANPKVSFPDLEKEVLQYWRQHKIFEQSVQNRTEKKFTFYDGPPFATGLPHYGHILAGVMKDVIPRYFTMQGYRVERRFGWDCHGLPVENIKEQELGISGKKDIEKMGIAAFNEGCRSIVQRYVKEWRDMVERTGRWVDMDNDYKTMDTSFMESIWWVFKQLWDKGLVYEGNKAMQICPRCVTPLSNFEVTQGYKDITDLSVIAKFPITDQTFLKKYGNGVRTSFIAWTTTPWSIPTTMALAVGKEFDYVLVRVGEEQIICAKNRLDYVTQHLPKDGWSLVQEFKGDKIVGFPYEHPFAQYRENPEVAGNKKVYHTYATDYVSIEDGTGIVTINGAFGEIDMDAAKKIGLPILLNVKMDGTYTDEMGELAGLPVKPKDDPTKMDHKIAELLEKTGYLFRKENYRHSYPHCWRCDTPLLNYATKSWFVEVTKLKQKMLKNNDQIDWMPESIKYGRFGKWLENARDWAISRSRYWGTPLPIWRCEKCAHTEVIGNLEELYQKVPQRMTKLVLVRHGHSEKNVQKVYSIAPDKYPLTERGRKDAENIAAALKNIAIDHGFASPALRARQTAETIVLATGVAMEYTDEILENREGIWLEKKMDDPSIADSKKKYKSLAMEERYQAKRGEVGESEADINDRMSRFLDRVLKEYSGQSVLLVSHLGPLNHLKKVLRDYTLQKFYSLVGDYDRDHFGAYEIIYVDNQTKKEFDLHKHIIDELTYACSAKGCQGTMHRIPEVLDCWFESGSMPYAQEHYPFESKEEFENNFPADFIAEGQDQTRGWFYTLIVLSTALFNKPAFKNVIVNGIVLAEDGKKMSKRLKNYPDPNHIFDTYGADAMRLYLMASPAVQAQDLRFSERGVDEVVKSVLLPLWNAYQFFVTYANIDQFDPKKLSKTFHNKMDQWILSELEESLILVTKNLDNYDLAGGSLALTQFIDGLTNWYIRRSRRRFWKPVRRSLSSNIKKSGEGGSENDTDKKEAYSALYIVLTTFCQLLAPYMPFISEHIYRNLTGAASVHLTDWPKVKKTWLDENLNKEVDLVRTIVTLGLGARAKSKIKVRQPLGLVEVIVPQNMQSVVKQYMDIILEELNIKELKLLDESADVAKKVLKPVGAKVGPKYGKEAQLVINNAKAGNFKEEGNVYVIFDPATNQEWHLDASDVEIVYQGKEGFDVESDQGVVVALDTHITEELRLEGIARDIVRSLQDMRKEANYNVADRIQISITGCDSQVVQVLEKFSDYIKTETLATDIADLAKYDLERELEIEGQKLLLRVKK